MTCKTADRFVLCLRRRTASCVHTGPHTKLSGYVRILPRENIRAALFEHNAYIDSFQHP